MSAAEVAVRRLTEDGTERFWALRLRALREHPEAFGRSSDESRATPHAEVRGWFRADSAPPHGFVLGAFLAAALVGTAGIARAEPERQRHKAIRWGVYMAPEARGRGVARRLVGEAIARARSLPGLEQIHLMVGSRSPQARSVYAAVGFAPFGLERRASRLGPGDYVDEEQMVLFFDDPSTP